MNFSWHFFIHLFYPFVPFKYKIQPLMCLKIFLLVRNRFGKKENKRNSNFSLRLLFNLNFFFFSTYESVIDAKSNFDCTHTLGFSTWKYFDSVPLHFTNSVFVASSMGTVTMDIFKSVYHLRYLEWINRVCWTKNFHHENIFCD